MLTYPRNTTHSIEHYRRVLLILISGLTTGHKQAVIARMLNDAHVLSATGGAWTTESVKGHLKKLRLKTGPTYRAMLELCFSGAMSPNQCRPLLQIL